MNGWVTQRYLEKCSVLKGLSNSLTRETQLNWCIILFDMQNMMCIIQELCVACSFFFTFLVLFLFECVLCAMVGE